MRRSMEDLDASSRNKVEEILLSPPGMGGFEAEPRRRFSVASTLTHPTQLGVRRPHTDLDGLAVAQWLVRLKVELQSRWNKWWAIETVSSQDEEVDRMATIIRTYRGIPEEEDMSAEQAWVDKPFFEFLSTAMVILNVLVIGLEVDLADPDRSISKRQLWIALEAFFCATFALEIALKVHVHAWKWVFEEGWNLVSLFVCICMWTDFVLHIFELNSYLRLTSLLRVLMLIRLMKTFSRTGTFNELRIVMSGFVDSWGTVCWVVILLFILLYMCSVFMTEQVGHNLDFVEYTKMSGGWDFEEHFGTIGRSMFTLLRIATFDTWSSGVARHVINMQWEMSIFFVIFITAATFGLLNIAVSIIIQQMLLAANNNVRRNHLLEDKQRRQELESIKEVFLLSDTNGSGEVDLVEFLEAMKNPEVQWRMRQLQLPISSAARLFAVIDGGGTRKLTISEFINGCKKLKGNAQSKDLLAIQAQADTLARRMDMLSNSLQDSERMMQVLDEVTLRTLRRFDSAVDGTRRKIARNVGGMKPLASPKPKRSDVPLAVGNRPELPLFPNLLR